MRKPVWLEGGDESSGYLIRIKAFRIDIDLAVLTGMGQSLALHLVIGDLERGIATSRDDTGGCIQIDEDLRSRDAPP
ncbi:MAG: hypothetical protein ACYCYF_07510, partial [Anaerolineae bacterium]